MSIYSFNAKLLTGEEIALENYKGLTTLIVNTASKCGLTPQYEGLEKLYKKFKNDSFSILAFPCNQFGGQEPGTEEEIQQFCSVNYNVTFSVFQKIDVNGKNAHPLYQYLREHSPEESELDVNSRLYKHLITNFPNVLKSNEIKWNFTKFLINSEGEIVKRYAPTTSPEEIEKDIERLIQTKA
ncbi:glutathione peroxidase [Bacillus sp. B15-48]|uniref:glutathione peroxidase n=1 Tax=Bacillus sp. B15-48 TaxID=1548601 RepID=UPI00193FF8D0|nr:glutathione peroxidase [Bacillus sp. B15-48]MBM4763292.1 glutathione peroxidase [Bacillus sp. B15-48]